jgi:hypothetical protein
MQRFAMAAVQRPHTLSGLLQPKESSCKTLRAALLHVLQPVCVLLHAGGPALQETARGADAARNAVGKAAGGAFQELQEQPAFLTAGQLRKYQLEGLNWLTYAWLKVRGCMYSLHPLTCSAC